MSSVQAWLLDLGPYRIAVAYQDVVEVVVEPSSWPLPIGPRWCRELLSWRGRYLPLARLGMNTDASFAVVVAASPDWRQQYYDYVALRLKSPPQLIDVKEEDDCDLPRQLPLNANHVLASFRYQDEVVVVPDLAALFNISQPAAA